MTETEELIAEDTLRRSSEAEALAALREFALGPIKAVFTWDEAGVILELIEMLTKGGIIEVAIRNPNVAEYMKHWEGRALAAEAQVQRLTASLAGETERCACIYPEPDIEVSTDAYSDGYTEGFADCLARYRSAILGDTYPELSLALTAHKLAELIAKVKADRSRKEKA